jgi:mercuric ion binding protein
MMKGIKIALPLALVLVVFISVNNRSPAPATEEETEIISTVSDTSVILLVKNMTCASCPYMVKKSLDKIAGVTHSAVSLETNTATVSFDSAIATVDMLIAATSAVGFPSSLISSN